MKPQPRRGDVPYQSKHPVPDPSICFPVQERNFEPIGTVLIIVAAVSTVLILSTIVVYPAWQLYKLSGM